MTELYNMTKCFPSEKEEMIMRKDKMISGARDVVDAVDIIADDTIKIDTNAETPKEMTMFYRTEYDFLPEGKTFKDLTPEELSHLKRKYRFDPLKSGMYQTITGVKGSI